MVFFEVPIGFQLGSNWELEPRGKGWSGEGQARIERKKMIPARGPQTGVLLILTLNLNLILNVNLI